MKLKVLFLIFSLLLLISCTIEEENQMIKEEEPKETATINPMGPNSHIVYSASSSDGLSWTIDEEPLIMNASVPDVAVTEDGKIRVYYLNFGAGKKLGQNRFSCIESSDNGETFYDGECSLITDSEVVADPSIVQLDDGEYRVYFYSHDFDQNVNSETEHIIKSAISTDGTHFTEEGIVLEYPGVVDPDVFWNGEKWILTTFSIADATNIIAESTDGLTFTYVSPTLLEGIITCQPVKIENDMFRVYGFYQSEQNKFYSFVSNDGLTWTQEEGIRLETDGTKISDPQVAQLPDGTWRMYFTYIQYESAGTIVAPLKEKL